MHQPALATPVSGFLKTGFGLTIDAWTEFPELQSAENGSAPEAIFRIGRVPEKLENPQVEGARYQASTGSALLWLETLGRFLVQDGNSIQVDPVETISSADLRSALLTSPLVALLLQRGLVPLHAASLTTSKGSILILGPTGMGKSVLALDLAQRGFSVRSDDISVLRLAASGQWLSEYGMSGLKLEADAIKCYRCDTNRLNPIRSGVKKWIYESNAPTDRHAIPIWKIYLLAFHSSPEALLESVKPRRYPEILFHHTCCPPLIRGLGLSNRYMDLLIHLARRISITRLWHQRGLSGIKLAADAIVGDAI